MIQIHDEVRHRGAKQQAGELANTSNFQDVPIANIIPFCIFEWLESFFNLLELVLWLKILEKVLKRMCILS